MELNLQYENPHFNGRVNIMGPALNQFQLFDHPTNNYKDITSYNDALNGNWQQSPLSKAFFSRQNIIILQNAIRALVYKSTNGIYNIAPQNETELKIIMRSIFLQNASHQPTHIKEQITELNDLVLEYAVPKIISEATAYIKYKNDVSTLAVPHDRPAYVNNKGDKQLELQRWF